MEYGTLTGRADSESQVAKAHEPRDSESRSKRHVPPHELCARGGTDKAVRGAGKANVQTCSASARLALLTSSASHVQLARE